ncbi:MAG: hypothetical protein D6822_03210 [Cyanobacteria bacterium J149]|nr:MAG: hypothetical protein D6822_03210 [Cyanobacteria bacterium J149]
MARPTKNNPTGAQKKPKMTPETLQKLEQAFAFDASIREACYYADIAESTYFYWVKHNPELLERFNRLRQKPVLVARKTVVEHLPKDPEFALKYLKNKKSDEFSERVVQDVQATINMEQVDEELERIIEGGES